MEGDSPGLETAACAALLQERFSLVAERHAEGEAQATVSRDLAVRRRRQTAPPRCCHPRRLQTFTMRRPS